jgi:hypothetical protein
LHNNSIGNIDEISSIKTNPNFVKVKGWIYNSIQQKVPKSLFIINHVSIIAGYAITGAPC